MKKFLTIGTQRINSSYLVESSYDEKERSLVVVLNASTAEPLFALAEGDSASTAWSQIQSLPDVLLVSDNRAINLCRVIQTAEGDDGEPFLLMDCPSLDGDGESYVIDLTADDVRLLLERLDNEQEIAMDALVSPIIATNK